MTEFIGVGGNMAAKILEHELKTLTNDYFVEFFYASINELSKYTGVSRAYYVEDAISRIKCGHSMSKVLAFYDGQLMAEIKK